jgi:hypothetical protein
MKKFIIAMLLVFAVTPAVAAQRWGTFKDNGCASGKGHKFRVYSSVLWGIPPGASWEVACSRMPATVHGQRFSHPTACVKASVVDAIGITAEVVSVAGLVYPPAGAAGAVLGGAAIAMDKGGVGGINMWGVFYVQVPHCP